MTDSIRQPGFRSGFRQGLGFMAAMAFVTVLGWAAVAGVAWFAYGGVRNMATAALSEVSLAAKNGAKAAVEEARLGMAQARDRAVEGATDAASGLRTRRGPPVTPRRPARGRWASASGTRAAPSRTASAASRVGSAGAATPRSPRSSPCGHAPGHRGQGRTRDEGGSPQVALTAVSAGRRCGRRPGRRPGRAPARRGTSPSPDRP